MGPKMALTGFIISVIGIVIYVAYNWEVGDFIWKRKLLDPFGLFPFVETIAWIMMIFGCVLFFVGLFLKGDK